MRNKVLHAITALLKIISAVLILLPALGGDPAFAALGGLAFVCISAAKDLLIALGDWLDDGKRNNSFTGKFPLLLACLLCPCLAGCAINPLTGKRELTPEGKALILKGVSDAAALGFQSWLRVHVQK